MSLRDDVQESLRPVGSCVFARVEAITVTIFRTLVMAGPFDDYAVSCE
jgi:hypothetical protein